MTPESAVQNRAGPNLLLLRRLHLGAKLLAVQGRSADSVALHLHMPAGEQKIDGSDILVAAGRIPNTVGIGLKLAGVALDPSGFVAVNDRLETSASAVWASANARAGHSSPMCPSMIFA